MGKLYATNVAAKRTAIAYVETRGRYSLNFEEMLLIQIIMNKIKEFKTLPQKMFILPEKYWLRV